MLANYNQGNKKLSLELQAYKIASDIRQAQENSLGAVQVPSFRLQPNLRLWHIF